MVSKDLQRILVRQHYKLVGEHSAVKLCHWLKKSLRDEGVCYKEQFYGISSHRCLQFTPSIAWCTHKCLFCWRNTEHTEDYHFIKEYEEPKDIIDEAISAQRTLLSGYGGVPDIVNQKKLKEAHDPNQVAISLAGEPTLYPKISEMIGEFNRKKFTTFLVTNGTLPNVLEKMTPLPTQLYVSLVAPDEEVYKKLCVPIIPGGWGKLNSTLDLFPSLDTRKVVRITLVKDWNDRKPEMYARLIERASPDFVEVKSYMYVGGSRRRMTIENMPSFEECEEFAKRINERLNYELKDEKRDSRVVLLSRKSK